MSNKNVIVVKKPKLLVAEGFLQRAVKDTPYLGVAMIHDGKMIVHHHGKPSVEDVQKLQTQLQEHAIILNFGENKTILEEDRQPFHLVLNKQNGDEVAVFMTGNFNGYEVKGSANTHEYHCFE